VLATRFGGALLDAVNQRARVGKLFGKIRWTNSAAGAARCLTRWSLKRS